MKLLVVGDLHGNMQVLEHLIDTNKPDYCVQLGDLTMYTDKLELLTNLRRKPKHYEEVNFANPEIYRPRKFNCPVITYRGASDRVYTEVDFKQYGVITYQRLHETTDADISKVFEEFIQYENKGVLIMIPGVYSRNFSYAKPNNKATRNILQLDEYYSRFVNLFSYEHSWKSGNLILSQMGCSNFAKPGNPVFKEGLGLTSFMIPQLDTSVVSRTYIHAHHHVSYNDVVTLPKTAVAVLNVHGLGRATNLNGLEKVHKIVYV
jgi:predicted phosphodiesterase